MALHNSFGGDLSSWSNQGYILDGFTLPYRYSNTNTIHHFEIYVSTDDPKCMQSVLLHEIGHTMEDYEGICDYWDQGTYNAIYSESGNVKGMTPYERSSQSEYFAEAFNYYYLHANGLASQAPVTYGFFDSLNNMITIYSIQHASSASDIKNIVTRNFAKFENRVACCWYDLGNFLAKFLPFINSHEIEYEIIL